MGCGTAGAAASLFLARAGHRVTLFERVPSPGPVGAGIMLQPTGLAVLARLGLHGAALAHGARIDQLIARTSAGRTVLDLAYADLHPSLFALGLHRGVLFETLLGAVREAPITLRFGVEIRSLEARGGRHLARDVGGADHGPFDLIVVADGARSHLRDQTGLVRRNRRYPWGALWFIGEDGRGESHALSQTLRGTTTMVGLLPTGRGPDLGSAPTALAKKPRLVSLFYSLRADAEVELRRAGLARFRERVISVAPEAASLVEQIQDLEQLTFAAYHDVVLARPHAPGLVCLGDAAHAMSPQLGQGANLALVDAMVLADTLGEAPSLDAALALYSARRRRHHRFYQFATRWLTPFFQSNGVALGLLRDAFMGPACRIGFVRREMLRSMAGLKLGVLGPSLPVPLPQLPAEDPRARISAG